MTEKVQEWISAIERPLRFLSQASPKKIPTVKNLSSHVLEVSRKALSEGLNEQESHLFRSLQELFVDFDQLTEVQKKDRVEKGLGLLHPNENLKMKKTGISFQPSDHKLPTMERLQEADQKLGNNVQFLKGVGPSLGAKFEKAGIRSVYELLYFFPVRYEDRRTITTISKLQEGTKATVMGTIEYSGIAFYKGMRRRVFEVVVEDGTSTLKLKWFRFIMGSMDEKLKIGGKLVVHGKVVRYGKGYEIHHPDIEVLAGDLDSISFGRVVPVYREISGAYQKTLRNILYRAVQTLSAERLCTIPSDICERQNLLPPSKSIAEIHFPRVVPAPDSRSEAERSISFEELFFYCLSLALRKKIIADRTGISFSLKSPRYDKLIKELPYELTEAQKTVLKIIRNDMELPKPMNRLLQGDVGSGKTVVAFLSALIAIDDGYQAAFLAPTEILAEQHFRTLSEWAKKVGIEVEILVGKHTQADRTKKLEKLKKGEVHLIVGTHALLEPTVEFKKLGFVIVDEQHRFGVHQRASIRSKGFEPDVLVMSATPIPRTLALTLYGDLDVSILNEMPKGRKPITTRVFREKDRNNVYIQVQKELEKGRQAFVVYPLVTQSDKIDLKDATSMAEHLATDIFPKFKVALIHGQMKSQEKDKTMQRFVKKEIDILVSTTVIEVGIDVPNSTVMVIEHPERFGLSQLHQLRGRVGRGDEQSFCLLILPDGVTRMAKTRVETFSRIHDGFLLAEEDLKERGPGDFFGAAQSGFPTFQVARFPRDLDILEAARREAFTLLGEDPDLKAKEHQHLKWVLDKIWTERIKLVRIG